MNPNRIKQAAAFVAEKIRKGETADVAVSITGEDVEGWLEDLAVATIRKDVARVKKSVREGQRRGVLSMQLALPGLEHASLPPVVWKKDEGGFEIAVPMVLASKAEIRREVQLNRRVVNVLDKVVGGWEETLQRLDELGVPDDAMGHEIVEQFGGRPGIEDGEDGDA